MAASTITRPRRRGDATILRAMAILERRLPDAASHLTRAKDDGRAESLLMALQAWERRGGQHGR
jgi:hypothetical protein